MMCVNMPGDAEPGYSVWRVWWLCDSGMDCKKDAGEKYSEGDMQGSHPEPEKCTLQGGVVRLRCSQKPRACE